MGAYKDIAIDQHNEPDPCEPPTIADALRKIRKTRRWSQSDLARTIGTLPSVVSKWERAHQAPNPAFLDRIISRAALSQSEAAQLLVPTMPALSHMLDSGSGLTSTTGMIHMIVNTFLPTFAETSDQSRAHDDALTAALGYYQRAYPHEQAVMLHTLLSNFVYRTMTTYFEQMSDAEPEQ